MTEKNIKKAMCAISESIKKNGDLELLRDLVEENGKISDETALEQFIKDSTSESVREFLNKQKLHTKPVTDSVVLWGDIEGYYEVGTDCVEGIGDGLMSYVFEELYCISTNGKLFKQRVLSISCIILDYEYTLSISIELFNKNVKWYANLNELTKDKDSPLHKYNGLFEA